MLTCSAMVRSSSEMLSACLPRPCMTCSDVTIARAIDVIFCGQQISMEAGRLQQTIAIAIKTSSGPAPFVKTSLVNNRKNTTVPATSVNARTIVFTRIPAGEAFSSIAVGVELGNCTRRIRKIRKTRYSESLACHPSSFHNHTIHTVERGPKVRGIEMQGKFR